MNQKFNESIEYLKTSPVFSMSLGSKELFHSNFWAWIIEQEYGKSFIRVFFPSFDLNNFSYIKREDNHRDLVIHDKDGHEFVIENKIKSYPSKEQLDGYHCYMGAITGISKPPFKLDDKWCFVSYKEISSGINEIINVVDDPYVKSLLSDYLKVLNAINDTLDYSVLNTKEMLIFWDDDIKQLAEIRMLDVFRKLKADDFVSRCEGIRDDMESLLKEIKDWQFYISRSFNTKEHFLTNRLKSVYNIQEQNGV